MTRRYSRNALRHDQTGQLAAPDAPILPRSRKRPRPHLLFAGLFLVGACVTFVQGQHESQHAVNQEQALNRLGASVLRTPIKTMDEWSGYDEDTMSPPDWQGTDISLRWTQINLTSGTISSRAASPWGGWFVSVPGHPLTVTVNAWQANNPMRRFTSGSGHSTSYHVTPASGLHPSAVHVTVLAGPVTVTPEPDGSTTLSLPSTREQQALSVWATTATMPQQHPWLTQVRVAAVPYATVEQVRTLKDKVDDLQVRVLFIRLFAGMLVFWAVVLLIFAQTIE